MIHILLLILKILGIILLSVLGLLLVSLLAVLFVPVRYRAEGSYHGQPALSVRVSWLLRLLVFRAQYNGQGLVCTIKVLGIRLWHNMKGDLEDGAETILGDQEQTLCRELQQDEENYRQARESYGEGGGRDGGQESGEQGTASRGAERQESGEQGTASREPDRQESGGKESEGRDSDIRGSDQKDGSQEECRGIPARVKSLAEGAARRIRGILEKLKFSFKRICDKLKGIREFTQEKRLWLEDEKNQASFKLLYRQTRRLLAHLWPVKGRCSVTFGFDDPYTTGQVLEAASLIYPYYHRQVSLYPVFDEKALDAEGWLKGRIRLSLVLWLALRVLMDGHTRRMLRGFLK